MKRIIIVLLSLLLFLTLGCSNPDRLFFFEQSHIGLIVKLSPESTAPADIDFGYRRSVVTLVPKANAEKKGEQTVTNPNPQGNSELSDDADAECGDLQNPNEVLSVISSFSADVGWFTAAKVNAYFATGEAACRTAKYSEQIRALVYPTDETQ